MPSEWYAPTQPFPLDARGRIFQYDLNGFSKDDLIDFTPELRAEAEKDRLALQDRTDLHAADRQPR